MAVTSTTPTVTTTPAALNTAETDYVGGASLAIKVPTGGTTVFLGGPGVTTANGYPVAAGEAFYLDVDPQERVYAVVATGSQPINVLARGV